MDAFEIQEIKMRCKYGNIGLYTPMTVLQIIEFFEQQLEKAREVGKVPLPRKVAEAIESYRKTFRHSVFILVDSVNQALRGGKTDKHSYVIANWVAGDFERGEILIKALVYGYTIEETPDDRLRERIIEEIEEWYHDDGDGDEEDRKRLANRIIEIVKEENKCTSAS